MNFLISTPGYNPASGGSIALHKLCHLLNEQGHNAQVKLWDGGTNPAWDTPRGEYTGQVVVYPEIIDGNPLNAERVVRWCLNAPGRLGGPETFPEGDHVVYMWDYFAPRGSKDILTVLEVQDCWQDYGEPRSGFCFSLRKGDPIPHKKGAEDIGATHDYLRLAELFNRKDYFYTNDDRTFLSQQAAMCGCISVVESSGNRFEWRSRMPINRLGVAWGWSAEELDYADRTKHLVRRNIEHIQANTLKQIDNLIQWLTEYTK